VKAWVPVLAVALALAPLAFVHPARVEGRSMEPALKDGRLVWVLRAWAAGTPERGQVWLVAAPEGPSIKRVVGLPGEVLAQVDGELWFPERRLEEPYASPHERGSGGPWRCGAGQYLLLGDNRPESRDGRAWGPLDRARLEGRVLGR
jgi:signal peptidase I